MCALLYWALSLKHVCVKRRPLIGTQPPTAPTLQMTILAGSTDLVLGRANNGCATLY